MTRGTPTSSQLIWLERRVAELEEMVFEMGCALKDLLNASHDHERDDQIVAAVARAKASINKLEGSDHADQGE